MRVLVICREWQKTFINKNIGKLLSRLNHKGYEIIYVCRKVDDEQAFRKNFPSVHLWNLNSTDLTTKGNLLAMLKIFFRLLVKRPDIVLWSYIGYMENSVLRLLKIPYILKSDSFCFNDAPVKGGTARVSSRMRLEATQNAKLIISETQENKKYLSDRLYPPVTIMKNGIPILEMSSIGRVEQSIRNMNKTILVTGRICHDKGIDILLNAFGQIKNRRGWKIKIIGDWPNDSYGVDLDEIIDKYNLKGFVEVRGFLTGQEYYNEISMGAFFVNPSRVEGLPNRFLELMYYGVPIVSLDVGYSNYFVSNETGILIKKEGGEESNIANSIESLISDPNILLEKSKNSISFVTENFNDDYIFNQFFGELEKRKLLNSFAG